MEKKNQWLEQFESREGRKSSPQEFVAAKEAGYPLVGEVSEEVLAQQWAVAFEAEHKRKPSPAEYMEAKKSGFQNSTLVASTKMQETLSEETEDPSQSNPSSQDPKTLWVQAF